MENNMDLAQVMLTGVKMDARVGWLDMMLKNYWMNIMLITLWLNVAAVLMWWVNCLSNALVKNSKDKCKLSILLRDIKEEGD